MRIDNNTSRRAFIQQSAALGSIVALVGASEALGGIGTPENHAPEKKQIVRLATIEVYAAQLENYKAALREGVETAVKVEPGVLMLYAVADKSQPTHITVIEIYADDAAYKAHLETAHFKKYKALTKTMIKSLTLVDVDAVVLRRK